MHDLGCEADSALQGDPNANAKPGLLNQRYAHLELAIAASVPRAVGAAQRHLFE
jgi:hypothetical protein